MTRSGRREMDASQSMTLLAKDEAIISASEGKKLLTGGQYLRVAAGTVLDVRFDIEVQGTDAEVELHQDLFLNGHRRFLREAKRLAAGQRWRLNYELHVPKPSDQLVVQLYATTVTGESVGLRFHSAQLSMRRGAKAGEHVNVIMDEVSTAVR